MAITFTQAAIDAAVNYLMTGGPNGGELTDQQYHDMVYMARSPLLGGSILSDFAWCIQLAINQGHGGLGASHNICRDKWGALNDAFMSGDGADPLGPAGRPGIAQNELQRFSVSISG